MLTDFRYVCVYPRIRDRTEHALTCSRRLLTCSLCLSSHSLRADRMVQHMRDVLESHPDYAMRQLQRQMRPFMPVEDERSLIESNDGDAQGDVTSRAAIRGMNGSLFLHHSRVSFIGCIVEHASDRTKQSFITSAVSIQGVGVRLSTDPVEQPPTLVDPHSLYAVLPSVGDPCMILPSSLLDLQLPLAGVACRVIQRDERRARVRPIQMKCDLQTYVIPIEWLCKRREEDSATMWRRH